MLVVKLYGVQEEGLKSIDEARFRLLLHIEKTFDNISPRIDANRQHSEQLIREGLYEEIREVRTYLTYLQLNGVGARHHLNLL